MRKRVLILAAAVLLLTLVLAIPASASKPIDVHYTAKITGWELGCQVKPVGNRCFVTMGFAGTYNGPDIYGIWEGTYSTLTKGPCEPEPDDQPGCGPGPFAYAESAHWSEKVTEASVRDEKGCLRTGSFTDSCNAKVHQNPHLEDWECVIKSGTGELANLRGIFKYTSADVTRWGQVHFDGK